jgi:hypothetical protein
MAIYRFPFGSIELTVSGVDYAELKTSSTLAENSDLYVPSQKAVKTYVDAVSAAKQDLLTNSAGLRGALSDETGTGVAVFATTPTLVTPVLGAATATSINGLIITTTIGTLTIPNNSSAKLITSGNFSITLTATAGTNVTLPTTGTLATLDGAETLTNKTITGLTRGGVGTYAAPITITGTDPDFMWEAHGKIATNIAGYYAGAFNSMNVTVTQSNDTSVFGTMSELDIGATTVTLLGSGNYAAAYGDLELSGTFTTPTDTGGVGWMGAVVGNLITPSTLTNNTNLACFVANGEITAGYTNNDILAGLIVKINTGKAVFPHGIYIKNDATAVGIYVGNTTTGINIAGTATTGLYIASATIGIDSRTKCRIGETGWTGLTGVALAANDPALRVTGQMPTASSTAGAYASAYSQLGLTSSQDHDVSAFGSWNELYMIGGAGIVLTGSGNYSAIWGVVEATGIVTSSTGNVAALTGSLTIPAGFVNNGVIAGCKVDAILHTSMTGSGHSSAFEIGAHNDANQGDWTYGLYIPASTVTTGISIVGSTKGMSVVSTLTGTGNLDANTITVTDNTTAGAFCRGFAVGVTAAGTKTGSGEVDGIGIDMTYTGNTTYGYNLSLYGAGSGNPTLGFISNISIYQDNLGTGVSAYCAIDVGIALSDAPADRYCYMRFRDHSTAIPSSVFRFEGVHCATYLFEYKETGTPDFIIGAAVSSTQDKKVKVNINGTPYYIPLYIA